ncbi:hypothetical protein, partial [Bacillus spizizenii]|uniref:hypothetical protein n=1 Tax=Bacillus spizizenii TaxID=96241 RepID=UPI0036F2D812
LSDAPTERLSPSPHINMISARKTNISLDDERRLGERYNSLTSLLRLVAKNKNQGFPHASHLS